MDERVPDPEDKVDNADPYDPMLDDEPDDELTVELVAYLDGELDAAGNEAVGARISLDAGVRSEADTLKKTWDLLDYLPRSEPSPSFTERTMSRIEPLRVGASSGVAVARSGTASVSGRQSGPIVLPRTMGRRAAIAAGWLLAFGVAGFAGWFIRSQYVDWQEGIDRQGKDARILSESRLLQNLKRYKHVDDLEFLRSLDNPDLFGDEQAAPTNEVPR